MILRSPLTGRTLARTGHALAAGEERWPVVDGIAFLRADRRDLAAEALAHLDAHDPDGAAMLLLADQDGWAATPPPDATARREAVRRRDALSFREAMALLALGPVADYFAHRWSDPTFLSGLALAQAYTLPGRGEGWFEIACGAGHYLRAFGPGAAGADLVFAKLWLARHFVAPDAALVCFDAAASWPLADGAAHTVFCHDAFYFLPDKPLVAREMRRVAPRVLIGHAHNAGADNLSAGQPLVPGAYAALFPGCILFDDRELTAALIDGRTPAAASAASLANAPAIALAFGCGAPGLARGPLTDPPPGAPLRRNPLYSGGHVAWPSERYRREYAALATYPMSCDSPADAIAGADPGLDALARSRVLLDLPVRW